MKQLIFALFCALAQAQPSSNPGFRLGHVRSIYIESLGTTDPAKLVRDQIVGFIVGRSTLVVETDRTRAHAILTGTAIVTSGEMYWAVGSSSSTSSAAAAATTGGSAAAAASSSSSTSSMGGRTIRITELGLQLSDEYGKILWAFDGSNCLDVTTLLMVGYPAKKPVIGCAIQQMVKAINKDAKKAAKP